MNNKLFSNDKNNSQNTNNNVDFEIESLDFDDKTLELGDNEIKVKDTENTTIQNSHHNLGNYGNKNQNGSKYDRLSTTNDVKSLGNSNNHNNIGMNNNINDNPNRYKLRNNDSENNLNKYPKHSNYDMNQHNGNYDNNSNRSSNVEKLSSVTPNSHNGRLNKLKTPNKTKSGSINNDRKKHFLNNKIPNLGNKTKSGEKPKNKLGGFLNRGKKTTKNVGKKAQGTATAAKKLKTVMKFLASKPVFWIILIVAILLIILLLFVVPAYAGTTTPGRGNDYKSQNNFSENDEKILQDINSITSETGIKNGELAMYAVAYPYFDTLQDGVLDSYIDKSNELSEEEKSQFSKWKQEKINEILDSYGCDDTCRDLLGQTTINTIVKEYTKEYVKNKISSWFTNEEEEEKEDVVTDIFDNEDDPYLKIFKKNKYKKKLKDLISKLNSSASDGDYSLQTQKEFYDYLKNTYFQKDAGYKALLIQAKDQNNLMNIIINEISSNAADFAVYFKETGCSTSYNYQSVGSITPSSEEMQQMMQGNVVIELSDAGCGNVNKCKSFTQMSLENYVKGVVYEEFGSSSNLAQIEAHMVATKGYTLSRRSSVGKTADGKYIIRMRWSTADQDFCDYKNGCEGALSRKGYANIGDCKKYNCAHMANRGPADDKRAALYDQAWEETKNVYVVDSNGTPKGNYQDSCSKGTCMSQSELERSKSTNFNDILESFYTEYAIATIDGEYINAVVGSSTSSCDSDVASTDGDIGIADDKFKFYFQNDYPNVAFCGATDSIKGCYSSGGSHTICTSGCGVTSYAMLVSNLSGTTPDFDPIKANNDAAGTGGCIVSIGTLDSLFTKVLVNKHTGFKVEQLQDSQEGVNKALQALKDGALIVANVQANSKLTTGGHWVVFRGIASDGKVKIADPNKSNNNKYKTYDLNKLVSEKWLYKSEDNTNHSWFAVYGPKSEEIKKANESQMNSSSGSYNGTGDWKIRNSKPTRNDKAFTEKSSNRGQCVWYAQARAYEVAMELGQKGILTQKQVDAIRSKLFSIRGDGGVWVERSKGKFKTSTNIKDLRAGAIISWKHKGAAGHVAFIEEVTSKTVTYTESWATNGQSCPNNWNCINFNKKTVSINEFYKSRGLHYTGNYSFSGYIYPLEKNGN